MRKFIMSSAAALVLIAACGAGATGEDAGTVTEPPASTTSLVPSSTTTTMAETPATTQPPATSVPEPEPATTTTSPADDVKLPVGASPFFVNDTSIQVAESFPVQVTLTVFGDLPTPCHEATWLVSGDDRAVDVTLWTESDPDVVCIQRLEPAELSIPLGAYAEGEWTVFINGAEVGEFSSP